MLLNHSGSKKAEWSRTDSGISYQLSKSKASLSSRVASKQLDEYRENTSGCQHSKKEIFTISTNSLRGFVSSLYRTRCSESDSRSTQKSFCHRFFCFGFRRITRIPAAKNEIGQSCEPAGIGQASTLSKLEDGELRWLVSIERG
jgi:hypothetical protein